MGDDCRLQGLRKVARGKGAECKPTDEDDGDVVCDDDGDGDGDDGHERDDVGDDVGDDYGDDDDDDER